VSKHSASGLDDEVDACVDRVVASIHFPRKLLSPLRYT
jgi:hypothetical protein